MLIKEYRIPLPLTVEEYRIAQLYMIAKKSRQESKGAHSGSGVEILVNEPYQDGPGGQGQYTHKIYHVGSHLPAWFKSLLPKSALSVEEKAWNAYPYTKTQFSCPFVEKFSLEIETYYTPDVGHLENVFKLSDSELRGRVVDHIDVVKDMEVPPEPDEDPTTFISEKTKRGPLIDTWAQDYWEECKGKEMPTSSGKAVMCAYKLCKVEFRYWGMQSRIERFIHDTALRSTMLRAHRQAWVWQDEWHGMTMEDIRKIEHETAELLKRTMRDDALDEEAQDEVPEMAPETKAAQETFNSIEYASRDVPAFIPKGSEMLPRRSISLTEEEEIKVNGSLAVSLRKRSKDAVKRSSRGSQHELSHIEGIVRGGSDDDNSGDEFHDCRENPEDLCSLKKYNSMELVRVPEEGEEGEIVPPLSARPSHNPDRGFHHTELRRAVSHTGGPDTSRRGTKHPTIELDEIRDSVPETSCSTTVLILVVHGGSALDPSTELAVRKSDVTTFRGAFESIMRQHYPSLVGHVVIKCVPCPSICGETLAILSNLNPYSFDVNPSILNTQAQGVSNDRLPIGTIPLFATASPGYQESVNQVITGANKIYQEFLSSEDGYGFSGQVCLIGDEIGAILTYDSLLRTIKRTTSESSVVDNEQNSPSPNSGPVSPHVYTRSDSPHIVSDHQSRLSAGPCLTTHGLRQHISEEANREHFQFDVSDFFIFGSPLGLLLAYRKVSTALEARGAGSAIARPGCQQVYNLFHPSDPLAARVEPLLSALFPQIPPTNVPRYQKYPMGDGQPLSLLELIQANPSVFTDSSVRSLNRHGSVQTTPGRVRRSSNESIQSGMFDIQQMQAIGVLRSKWWGDKRIDYALYSPEGLANFPTNSLPHLFHASYWESADVISFILRQLVRQENDHSGTTEIYRHSTEFSPNQAREKWIKKRTSVKIKNGAANHRGNDAIVREGNDQSINGKFSYGPLDMAALTCEKVDLHLMKDPPGGEWTLMETVATDKSGRINYRIPPHQGIGYGVYPIKMVVRGDHTVLDLHLAVVPPDTEAVVFSIDGSFTASVSVTGKDPKVRPGAVDVVRHWQDLGYLILYVTGRPCMQLQKVKSWLSMHNFPHGLVSFADGLSTDPLRHKTEYLRGLQQEQQVILHAAYGSSKDISVYSSLGIKPENTHIMGKVSKKQTPICNVITDGYVAHLANLQSPLGSRPAQGNARMVIPKTCFGLPGQFSGNRRRTIRSTKRTTSFPVHSLGVSTSPFPSSPMVRNSAPSYSLHD